MELGREASVSRHAVMLDSESDDKHPPFIFTYTETGRSETSKNDLIRVEWRIEDFGTTWWPIGKFLSSPIFSTEPFWRTPWQLQLWPNGRNPSSRSNLSLFLFHLPNTSQLRSAEVDFYLRGAGDVRHMEMNGRIVHFRGSKQNTCGSDKFAHRPDVFGLREELFPEETLTIVCDLYDFKTASIAWPVKRKADRETIRAKVKEGSEATQAARSSGTQNAVRQIIIAKRKEESIATQTDETSGTSKSHGDPQIKLCRDMVALLKDANMCDVTLRAEGRDLGAHKLVLAARSIVFRTMFEHPMREKVDNVVEVADIEFDCLERFVTFLYSGDTGELTTESALGLLTASDKYAVQDLCEICTRYLQEHLDIENSLDILVVADLHDVVGLKEVALAFVCRHFKEVSAQPDWRRNLKGRPHLAAELLVALTKTDK